MAYAEISLGNAVGDGAMASINVPDNRLEGCTVGLFDGDATLTLEITLDGATWIEYLDRNGNKAERVGTVSKAYPLQGTAQKARVVVSLFAPGVAKARFGTPFAQVS